MGFYSQFYKNVWHHTFLLFAHKHLCDFVDISHGYDLESFWDGDKTFYYAIGADAGVGFFTGYYPAAKIVVSAFCNTGYNGASLLFDELLELVG